MRPRLAPLFVSLILCSGCAVKTAQHSVQVGLTALAAGIDTTDALVDENMAHAGAEAREASESYEEWRVAMLPWWQVLVALEDSMAAVQTAQEALDLWVTTGNLPRDWGPFCDELGALLDRVVALLHVVGLPVPEAVDEATHYVGVVCNVIADWAGGNP